MNIHISMYIFMIRRIIFVSGNRAAYSFFLLRHEMDRSLKSKPGLLSHFYQKRQVKVDNMIKD